MTKLRLLAPLALGLVATSCNEHPLVALGDTLFVASTQPPQRLTSNAVDILWMVDNSGSMKDEQAELGRRFDEFVSTLTLLEADFRLAVVSSDYPRNGGRFQTGPGNSLEKNCATPPNDLAYCSSLVLERPYLEARNYLTNPDDPSSGYTEEALAQLQRDFSCIARAGDCGNSLEGGLEAVTTSLSRPLLSQFNDGFVRDEAFLVVVFLSDEDDCSTGGGFTPVEDYQCYASEDRDKLLNVGDVYDALVGVKGSPESILVAGLVGPADQFDPWPIQQIRENGGVPDSCTAAITESCEAGATCPDGTACPAAGFCTLGFVNAKDGERYRALIERFGARGVNESICQASFSAALTNISRILGQNLSVNCVAADPRPATCTSDADCSPGVQCMQPLTGNTSSGFTYCDNFAIKIDVAPPDGGTWTTLRGPGTVDNAATPNADAQFFVDYDASQCSSGISFSFAPGERPDPNSLYRVSYPAAVDIVTAADNEEQL